MELPHKAASNFAAVQRNFRYLLRLVRVHLYGFHNIKWYGAHGDGTTDDSIAVQAAIDAAYAAGGGIVWVPPGTFLCNVIIKPYVGIMGTGWRSILQTNPHGSTTPVIGSIEAGALGALEPYFCSVMHLRVIGNNGTTYVDGIRIVSSNSDTYNPPVGGYTVDSPGPYIQHVWTTDCKIGMVIGRNMRDAQVHNCLAYHCRDWGIEIRCTDSYFAFLSAGACGNGIKLYAFTGGTTGKGYNRLVGCKAWYNIGASGSGPGAYTGTGIGFYIGPGHDGNMLNGCEGQDNFDYDYKWDDCEETAIKGSTAGGATNGSLWIGNGATYNDIGIDSRWADRVLTSKLLVIDGSTTTQNEIRMTPPAPGNRTGGFVWYSEINSGTIAANSVSFGKVRARVYNDANISVANNTDQALTFNQERRDSEAVHSTSSLTSRLTAPRPGWYTVTGTVSFAASAVGKRRVGILLNGTVWLAAPQQGPSPTGVTNMNVSTETWLDVGDYVELTAFQDTGGALNILTAARYSPEFAMSCE